MFELLAFGVPGGPEMLILLVILLFLFGAQKIPKLARGIGSGVSEFKAGLREGKERVEEESTSMKQLVSESAGSTENEKNGNGEKRSS